MSEFYKEYRNFLIMNKKQKVFGVGCKVIYYGCRLVALFLLIFVAYMFFSRSIKSVWEYIFLLCISVALYFASTYFTKLYRSNRKEVVCQFINTPNKSLDLVNTLVNEIESSIKRMKTFATWISGLVSTLTALFVTISTNILSKITDIVLESISRNWLSKIISSITVNNQASQLLCVFLNFLCIGAISFLLLALIIYSLVILFTFLKKQTLIFLLDVRHEMLTMQKVEETNRTESQISINWGNAYLE